MNIIVVVVVFNVNETDGRNEEAFFEKKTESI